MKIHVLGASGSGVTTTGCALSECLHIPYFDTDQFFWENTPDAPFTQRKPAAARNQLLTESLNQHTEWILGGSMINWQSQVVDLFDLIVFLWLPPTIRLSRVHTREQERYGDTLRNNPARQQHFQEYIDWCAGYDDNTARGRTLAAHEKWLKQRTCPIMEIRGDITLSNRIDLILKQLHSQFF